MRINGVWLWMGLLAMLLGMTVGCATTGTGGPGTALAAPQSDAPPELPEPQVVLYTDPVTTLDPFALAVPAPAKCAKYGKGHGMTDNATVDPFCLAPPQPGCVQPGGTAIIDDDSIIDPFCQPADNGG